MKNFNLLSQEYYAIFLESVNYFSDSIIRKNVNKYLQNEFSLFYPSFGASNLQKLDFVIYGQATNGWNPNFTPGKLKKDLISKAIEYSNTTGKNEVCPLDWVNKEWGKFRLFTSCFWNVT